MERLPLGHHGNRIGQGIKGVRMSRYTNRLIHETSPYLLQHAHNPVDWYAWGTEALERAQSEDKPILLSIGYSACHWCHVMEHESFENEKIALAMNENFINIKVDREERPDLDQIYMGAVQAMTGSGGWPLTVFLLPTGEPFFGGTYFPSEDRYGRPGFPKVLAIVLDAYRNKRDEINENARYLAGHIARSAQVEASADLPDISLLEQAFRTLGSRFDSREGGFGGAPKFPPSMNIDFLLRYCYRTHDELALHMAMFTLDKMAGGGMYDQVGGGFHRYSTDEHWLVPHFEKMLYDNALLARVYLDAFRATKKPLYRRISEQTLDYVVREMRDPSGGFYSAQDADSEGIEGKYYVWSLEEFRSIVGPDSDLLGHYWDVTAQGNWEHQNILNVDRPTELFSKVEEMPLQDLESRIQSARAKLYSVREQRVKPGRDEKILTDWNGLMLRAYAEAAFALDRDDYGRVAVENAEFLLRTMWNGERLLHNFKDGRARFNGYLDDYANLADGLLALYQLTFDYRWLDQAVRIVDCMLESFWDTSNGGFYFTASNHEPLISRTKDFFDNATPSGNSVAADVLARLASLLDRTDYRQKATQLFSATLKLIKQYPSGFGRMLAAMDFHIGPSREIAIVGDVKAFLPVLRNRYQPRTVCAAGSDLRIPLLKERPMLDGKPTAYVCENYACQQPATDPAEFEKQLNQERTSGRNIRDDVG
jgi:uncharacterized protein YyaL (SSP411 family)